MNNPVCPECGNSVYIEKYKKDGCYICAHKPDKNKDVICGTIIGCECVHCGEFLPIDRFGLKNDTYECKTCGHVQWGYTEYMRSKKDFENALASFTNNLKSLQSDMLKKIEQRQRNL